MGESREITRLPELLRELPPEERALFGRVFEVFEATGRLVLPEKMRPWIEANMGPVERVAEQRVVRVTNRVTLEGTLFNSLRASRPLETETGTDLRREIAASEGDPFCRPEEGTPENVFGRVRGRHATTAANIAMYDAYHGVIVFDDHDPLRLNAEKVADYIEVGLEWHRRVLEADPEHRYLFLMWNCLWRAGGSIIHGHAQAVAARGSHYPKVERLRRAAAAYRAEHGSGYFEDLLRIHEALGLSVPAEGGAAAFASLTPVKEKELVVLGPSPHSDALKRSVGRLLERFVGELGVTSFNVAFYLPPSGPAPEDWSGFPAVVRIVDRGDPASRTSDIGAMELYAAPVVASDPFRVAAALRG
ncbi:conserved hypothetical protein [Rubrobacter xylanophilus DSM 9941]|uniref:Uncharacterized protein n=1 Tax=Rubrobacter xylanophilus (strain DSM 9941 / JCM 11954 / NBRC 16129 / PRD-1) TaxID=266117 RepID=Q1ASZ2_RUBXD|nr:hypothetical protein [Rubrobacter xylanophilus]ABG05486.1 conserved hypothetical protein [Rubrobacter xylanophilus DSM 9941]